MACFRASSLPAQPARNFCGCFASHTRPASGSCTGNHAHVPPDSRKHSMAAVAMPLSTCHQTHRRCCCTEAGHVTSERVARLCGDHLEHCYEAQRLTTHGTTCVSIAWHTEAPAAAANAAEHSPAHAAYGPPCNAAGQPNTVVCSTSTNSVAVFNTATAACVWQQTKGPRRCSNAFTPSLSHVAVYGDPMAPAIELQFLGKFAFLEGHTGKHSSAEACQVFCNHGQA